MALDIARFSPPLDEPLHTIPCPGCRVEVVLHPSPWGKPDYYRPIGTVLVQGPSLMESRTAFVPHSCAELEAWQRLTREERERIYRARRVESRRQGSAEQQERWDAYRADLAESWAVALKVACPKCEAKPGNHCANLVERKRHGVFKPTVWPHPERMVESTKPVGPDLGAQIEREGGIS